MRGGAGWADGACACADLGVGIGVGEGAGVAAGALFGPAGGGLARAALRAPGRVCVRECVSDSDELECPRRVRRVGAVLILHGDVKAQ